MRFTLLAFTCDDEVTSSSTRLLSHKASAAEGATQGTMPPAQAQGTKTNICIIKKSTTFLRLQKQEYFTIYLYCMFLLDAGNTSFFWQLLGKLKECDTQLFLKINTQWTNSFADSVFPWWREASTWLPLYFFLSLFVFMNFGWRAARWLFFLVVMVAITDQLSSSLIKYAVNRPRPCNVPELMPYVRTLLGYCSQSPSFTSSHATNHFALAFFLFLTLKPYFKKWSYLFFFWAASISYGQVYVGIHYPLDITCGAILGSIIGIATAKIFIGYVGLEPTPVAGMQDITVHSQR